MSPAGASGFRQVKDSENLAVKIVMHVVHTTLCQALDTRYPEKNNHDQHESVSVRGRLRNLLPRTAPAAVRIASRRWIRSIKESLGLKSSKRAVGVFR